MDLRNLCFYTFVIASITSSFCIESVVTNIANKKLMNSKEKSYSKIKINKSPDIRTTDSTLAVISNKDNDSKTTSPYLKNYLLSDDAGCFETTTREDITTTANIKFTTNSLSDSNSCTCGIFLSSQLLKGPSEPPRGDAVISNTLERSFACTHIGQKQCQIKCLEQVVQHLPNSANILCASLDRDIYKEKAFLFVRNCKSKWYNTKLTAGRPYCCKNGLPYNCFKKLNK